MEISPLINNILDFAKDHSIKSVHYEFPLTKLYDGLCKDEHENWNKFEKKPGACIFVHNNTIIKTCESNKDIGTQLIFHLNKMYNNKELTKLDEWTIHIFNTEKHFSVAFKSKINESLK